VEGGSQTKGEGGQDGDAGGERDDNPVEPGAERDREPRGRHPGLEEADAGGGHEHSRRTADQGQEQSLGEQLPDDLRAAGAEREADRNLPRRPTPRARRRLARFAQASSRTIAEMAARRMMTGPGIAAPLRGARHSGKSATPRPSDSRSFSAAIRAESTVSSASASSRLFPAARRA
jgi:hypothetical protein